MNFNPVIFSIPIFFTLIVLEIIYAVYKRPDYYKVADTISNINCGIGDQVIGMMTKVITIGIYQYLFENYALFHFESSVSSFLLLFLLVDFLYYWKHRLSHEINLLWLGHSIHHQSEEYNLSVALRQSWFDKFFSFPFYLPLAWLGFDTQSFIIAVGLNLLYQFWVHTELVDRMGFLEYFMSTPSHHRVHHARNPEYIDKNHGGVFIIWDRLFGTFKKEVDTPVYGVTQPIQTWNAFEANVGPWIKMFNEVVGLNQLKDKFLIWLKPPGWRPEALGGQLLVPAVDKKSYHKFSTNTPKWLTIYLVVTFVLFLLGVAIFLNVYPKLASTTQMVVAAFIFWNIINFGVLFEHRKIGYFSELTKSLALLFSSFFLFAGIVQIVLGTIAALSAAAITGLYYLHQNKAYVTS